MNTFNKYRSHFIAGIGTLAFYGLFIMLLFMKPFGNSANIDPDNEADQEVPIIFQKDLIQADVTLPPPPNTQSSSDVTTKETASKEPTPGAEAIDNGPQNEDVSTIPAKPDSVLIADIKKMMVEIKSLSPDSLPKEITKPKDNPKTHKEALEIAQNNFEDKKFYYDNYRAIQSFKKVYPYVQKTKEIIIKLNAQLAQIKNNKDRHILIKKTEKELYLQFEKDVRNMSTSQGKLLLKLIARETDQSAFGIIKTYKGIIPATFWYGVGLIFHENMKSKYDSIGEDAQLEKIVQKYKLGKL